MSNPLSRRNLRDPKIVRRLRAVLDGEGEVIDASTPDQLDCAVERLRAARIDLLGVNGGDGTGHMVLTAFARAYGLEPLPKLLLLRGGAMNTVAHAHSIRGGRVRILRSALAQLRAGVPLRTADRDLLSVESDGGSPRYGFIFGTGVVVTFLEAYYRSGHPIPAVAVLLLCRAIASAAADGAFAASLVRRERLRISTDGEEWPDSTCLAIMAGSVPEIGFGFKVFARCDEQPGFFHAVSVHGTPAQVARALHRIHRGRPWRRRVAQDEVVRELFVEGDGLRFTIDGDLYAASRSVRVSTGPAVEVVLP